MTSTIKQIVEDTNTPAGRIFDLVMIGLICIALVAYAVETLPTLNDRVRLVLHVIEVGTLTLFTLEYLLRVAVAERKRDFIFSWHGIVDFLAIAPSLMMLGVDLRFLRIIRLFRVFRVFKLARYSTTLRVYARAFRLAKEELLLFAMAALMLMYISAALLYHFENPVQPEVYSSMFSSLWWAVVTLTTVGYGDMVPATLIGRSITFFLLLLGIGVIAIPSGIMATALQRARATDERDVEKQDP